MRIPTILSLMCAIACFQSVLYAQRHDRVVEKISWRTEPIEIQKIETKAGRIEIGKKFAEADDWLDDFKVTVKNTSGKVVTRIVIGLSFPRPIGTSEDIPTYFVDMMYGLDPADVNFDPLKQVNPGEVAVVRLINSNVPLIKKDLNELGYPDPISRVQLKIKSVIFIDGTVWAGDRILFPDPRNPKNKMNPRRPLKSEPNTVTLLRSPPLSDSSRRPISALIVPVNYVTTLRKPPPVLYLDVYVPCNTDWYSTDYSDCGQPRGPGLEYARFPGSYLSLIW